MTAKTGSSSEHSEKRTRSRSKQRLDLLLVGRNFVESREKAQRLIMAGEVLVDEVIFDKPGKTVEPSANIRIRSVLPYVSRGGLKLEAALEHFRIDVTNLIALDVGASTGGFTDCLLQRGVRCVYAVDVGYGQFAWKLRQDPRVVLLERTNIRYLEQLPPIPSALLRSQNPNSEQRDSTDQMQVHANPNLLYKENLVDFVVIDTSFISLRLVLPATQKLAHSGAQIVALIKPQFEAGKENVGKGGVVRNRHVHRQVLEDLTEFALTIGLQIMNLTVSPIRGPARNVEFLIHLMHDSFSPNPIPLAVSRKLIDQALEDSKSM